MAVVHPSGNKHDTRGIEGAISNTSMTVKHAIILSHDKTQYNHQAGVAQLVEQRFCKPRLR